MNFKSSIIWSGKIYKFLEKINMESHVDLDRILDLRFPHFVSQLQSYAKVAKIAACSTNGKKTTVNLLNQIIKKASKTTYTNVLQDAKKYPIFTSIVLDLASNSLKETEKDFYTMAMNEFELSGYFNAMKFDYLLLGNLFDNQNDFCSLEEKRKKIQEAIVLNSKLNLIINADEPLFYDIDEIKNDTILSKKRNKFYYGFDEIEFCDDGKDLIQKNDITKCPICSCSLDYKKRYYSHLGKYDCECGFKRPRLDLSATAKVFNNYTFLTTYYKDNKMVFKLPFGGVYNAYNALGAIAVALNLNIDRKTITSAFEDYKYLKARDEIITYQNKQIKIKVVNNPVSFSEAVKELYGTKKTKVVFCFNDNIKDGMDVAWMWNSNLKSLEGFENKIFVCGTRFDDMALKLKYSGVNPCLITMDDDIKSSVGCCFYELEKDENMLVLTVPSGIDEVYKVFE